MKRPPLPNMTIHELVQMFVEISFAQGQAIDSFQTAKVNRLTLRRVALRDELVRRPEDACAALATLFTHSNAWVRYDAADTLLYEMPESTRPVIQAVVDSKDFPIAGHAGMTLSFFDGELRDLGKRRLKTTSTPSSSFRSSPDRASAASCR